METYATIYQLRTSWSESNKENLITGGHKGTKVVDTNTTQSSEIVITPLIYKSSVCENNVAVAVNNNNEVSQNNKIKFKTVC